MLDISVNNKIRSGKKYSTGFFIGALEKVMAEAGLTNYHVGLSINLVDESRIKSLNKKFRNKNEATDVLSFPTGANKKENDILELGDIFLCFPIIKKVASQEKTDLNSKLILLTVHGCLHLLGYDHEKSVSERKKMFALQEKIIKKCVNK